MEQWHDGLIYDLTDFIGVDRHDEFHREVIGAHNDSVTKKARKTELGMPKTTACLLAKEYDSHNENLFKRLGRSIPGWIISALLPFALLFS